MGSMSIVHWMIVVGIVVLLFGRHKISDLMGDVANGIKSFKKGMRDDEPSSSATVERPPESLTLPSTAMPVGQTRAEDNT
jgi:sec-independent protein translocase protein TatA